MKPSSSETEQAVDNAERGWDGLTATYSPEDDTLRLYTGYQVDQQTDAYARMMAAGFTWFPEQEVFVAKGWTPERADLLTQLGRKIDDEDRPIVRGGEERLKRIRELEAKHREMLHRQSNANRLFRAWRKDGLTMREVKKLIRLDPGNLADSVATKSSSRLWDTIRAFIYPKATAAEIAEKALLRHWKAVSWTSGWIKHYQHRLSYEQAMLVKESGQSPKNSETSAISSGIQTPCGPIAPTQTPSQPKLSKAKQRQPHKRGNHL